MSVKGKILEPSRAKAILHGFSRGKAQVSPSATKSNQNIEIVFRRKSHYTIEAAYTQNRLQIPRLRALVVALRSARKDRDSFREILRKKLLTDVCQ